MSLLIFWEISYIFKFFLNFYWDIIEYNIILVLGVQHNDSIFIYIMNDCHNESS